jgi:alkanesulfonate monooxygenase SsuD/methylene tetrahydromethanopterin reductase-like flavin-dependent oxidoreductase (luciferase family)
VDLRRVQMAYGIDGPIPSLETAQAWQPDDRAQAVFERERPRSIIGTPQQVAERMLALKDRFAADEIVVLTVAASYAARLRSYELLAEAFGLPRSQ